MPQSKLKLVSEFRRRLKRRGIVRVEVQVYKKDAALVRGVARALCDPLAESDARALLLGRFGSARAKGLKTLLASAPLDGIDLTRHRDVGRKISL